MSIGAEDFQRQADDHQPRLNESGRAAIEALGEMDGDLRVEDISAALHESFPSYFPSPLDARAFVTEIAFRYAK